MEIKDYLHLYLGCKCKGDEGTMIYTLASIARDCSGKETYILLDSMGNACIHIPFKLILRKLSDMTEKETKEMEVTQEECKLDGYPKIILKVDSGETFRYMLSKSFDLFGLIDAKLAIDKTKL